MIIYVSLDEKKYYITREEYIWLSALFDDKFYISKKIIQSKDYYWKINEEELKFLCNNYDCKLVKKEDHATIDKEKHFRKSKREILREIFPQEDVYFYDEKSKTFVKKIN